MLSKNWPWKPGVLSESQTGEVNAESEYPFSFKSINLWLKTPRCCCFGPWRHPIPASAGGEHGASRGWLQFWVLGHGTGAWTENRYQKLEKYKQMMAQTGSSAEKPAFAMASVRVKVKSWLLPTGTYVERCVGISVPYGKAWQEQASSSKDIPEYFGHVWHVPYKWPT